MDPHRSERLAQSLREELDELISYEMSDPRVSGVAVTEVIPARDRKKAQVRVSIPDNADAHTVVEALEHARPWLRHEIARRLEIFRVPDLHFEQDLAMSSNARMEYLLKRVRRGRPREENPGANNGS